MAISGTSGNDTLTGTTGNDIFNLGQGGNDTVSGLGGNDTFRFGTTFTAADHVDGGTGNDTIELNGDYSAGLTLGANTITAVEAIKLDAGFKYALTLNDGNVAAGNTLSINASALTDGNTLTFNGSAETDGTLHVTGGTGNDSLTLGAHLTTADRITGGGGDDELFLAGNYSMTFTTTTLRDIAHLALAAGNFTYHFNTNDANVESDSIMRVDGAALGAGNTLIFNGAKETDGSFSFDGGAGVMELTGGAQGDQFVMGDDLTNSDRLNGGAGSDALFLDGDYSISLKAAALRNIADITLAGGSNYHIISGGNTGGNVTVDGSQLGAGDSEYFNAKKESGSFTFTAGAGPATLIGGAGSDNFDLTHGGLDVASGGGGNDGFLLGASLTAADQIDGGTGGGDALQLDGNYTGANALVFNPTTMVNIDNLYLLPGAGNGYDITTDDATVAAGASLVIQGGTLTTKLTFDGSAETDGGFYITGGKVSDSLTGGAQTDRFVYDTSIGVTGAVRDTIHAFDFANDVVQFADVSGIASAFTVGSVNAAAIDSDLQNIVNSSRLPANDAVLYTAKTGNLAGHTFLIVDGNGIAGYQTGSDLVIELSGALHTGSINIDNFIE